MNAPPGTTVNVWHPPLKYIYNRLGNESSTWTCLRGARPSFAASFFNSSDLSLLLSIEHSTPGAGSTNFNSCSESADIGKCGALYSQLKQFRSQYNGVASTSMV